MKPKLKQISPLLFEFEWESNVSDLLLQQQLSFKSAFEKEFSTNLCELRMGFKTLSALFSIPLVYIEIKNWLNSFSIEESTIPLPQKIWQIPVCYADQTGRDLEALAKAKQVTVAELIALHSKPLYRLHFYGFLPGFMYLNGLPKILHTARKVVPDREVPVGSIAIGGAQTGIYPSSSPGGWHLIGQTPITMFDADQARPVFASVGERIEFTPISILEFDRLKRHPMKPKFR
ncbi:5-oxoprolinase subunit PxpB [Algoriphagus winogradskyi]|uniref:Inhibitor of KinA n=1 Tax=Algoriphagus winogradskyi TaxID=237017 RepID=A0ABY1NA55_9BACT|nr:5-oxoprolinase subunit PxpB [Algoriphagus winogradskyi]SMP04427.1 inhibitor of KinA [Algoriphagus winogradskyi]